MSKLCLVDFITNAVKIAEEMDRIGNKHKCLYLNNDIEPKGAKEKIDFSILVGEALYQRVLEIIRDNEDGTTRYTLTCTNRTTREQSESTIILKKKNGENALQYAKLKFDGYRGPSEIKYDEAKNEYDFKFLDYSAFVRQQGQTIMVKSNITGKETTEESYKDIEEFRNVAGKNGVEPFEKFNEFIYNPLADRQNGCKNEINRVSVLPNRLLQDLSNRNIEISDDYNR